MFMVEIIQLICTYGVCYSVQAPVSMKAVCQAAWLWTVAFGNLIVIIIAESRIFENQVRIYFYHLKGEREGGREGERERGKGEGEGRREGGMSTLSKSHWYLYFGA